MSKSPLKPWRALSDCETIHALRTAWIGTFQQHLCLHHENSSLLTSPTWYMKVSQRSHIAMEQKMDLKHMVLKPLPHPVITRDSARHSRPVDFPSPAFHRPFSCCLPRICIAQWAWQCFPSHLLILNDHVGMWLTFTFCSRWKMCYIVDYNLESC